MNSNPVTTGSLVARLLVRSEVVLAAGFASLILVGACLLRLPIAHRGPPIGLLDALFTATSAVCVTGLTVVDTGTTYTRFGQAVILVLIQLGGLGIMTFAAIATQILGSRLSFRSQALVQDTFYQTRAAANIRRDLKRIVALTLIIEFVGVLLLYLDLRGAPGGAPPLFSAVFHAVSAFCNAGFSIYSDNLVSIRAMPLTMLVIAVLIILGGLGHTVVLESGRRLAGRILRWPQHPVRWSLNSRIVLTVSAALIIGGAAGILVFGLTPTEESWGAKAAAALFHSVSARTAGFNTLDLALLPAPTLLILIALMFIGGSPASCAGGIKTTSLATWLAEVRSRARGGRDVALWGRRLPPVVIERARAIIGLAVVWNLIGILFLSTSELSQSRFQFEDVLFEQVSAFATVGLSTGVTPHLTPAGKLWIIATMFVGRLGPLTMALAVLPMRTVPLRYPEERVLVG